MDVEGSGGLQVEIFLSKCSKGQKIRWGPFSHFLPDPHPSQSIGPPADLTGCPAERRAAVPFQVDGRCFSYFVPNSCNRHVCLLLVIKGHKSSSVCRSEMDAIEHHPLHPPPPLNGSLSPPVLSSSSGYWII